MASRQRIIKNVRNSIYSSLAALRDQPKVAVEYTGVIVGYEKDVELIDINKIFVKHQRKFVPDLELVWSPTQEHFLVYICTADREYEKVRAGYSICTIKSRLEAVQLVNFYLFLARNRANNKGDGSAASLSQASLFN